MHAVAFMRWVVRDLAINFVNLRTFHTLTRRSSSEVIVDSERIKSI